MEAKKQTVKDVKDAGAAPVIEGDKQQELAPKVSPSAEKLLSAFSQAGIRLFQQRSGFPLSQAQRNLEGRTSYADDNQLKVRHNSNIVGAEVLYDGLLFGIIESFRTPMGALQFRPVFFDLFGNIVWTIEESKCPTSVAKANGMFWMQVEEIDPAKANYAGIKQRQEVLHEEVRKLDELAKLIEG